MQSVIGYPSHLIRYNLFFPLKTDIDLYYKNQNMKKELDKSLGLIFGNVHTLTFNIIAKPGTKRPKPKKNGSKKSKSKSKSPQKVNIQSTKAQAEPVA